MTISNNQKMECQHHNDHTPSGNYSRGLIFVIKLLSNISRELNLSEFQKRDVLTFAIF